MTPEEWDQFDALTARLERLESLTNAMRKELEAIEEAIDDPRLDLTHTAVELITEYKQRLKEYQNVD